MTDESQGRKGGRRNIKDAWWCIDSLEIIRSLAKQVKYPPSTTCVKGLGHDIQPRLLSAGTGCTHVAVPYAVCCLAKRSCRKGQDDFVERYLVRVDVTEQCLSLVPDSHLTLTDTR